MDFKKLKEKAKAFAQKSKQDNQNKFQKQQKQIRHKLDKKLPKIESLNATNEAAISEYMNVLRQTHELVGKTLLQERLEKKKEEKFKNINYIKMQESLKKNSGSLKRRIRMMRKKRLFPQPKSYMNYQKRNGLLKKNSILIER